MSAHENVGKSDEWYTPKFVFDALGKTYDLDVAHPGLDAVTKAGDPVDWVPARRIITSGSLEQPWDGFIWMNPPFGKRNGLVPWLEKFFAHGNGVALVPDRSSAPWWQVFAPQADLTMFCAPKIHFVPGPGVEASSPGQGTTLLARGPRGVQALENAQAAGLGSLWRYAGRAT